MKLRGSMCALITPFINGKIDTAAVRAIVDWQIAEGTTGLVPAGTTGECATLTEAEHLRVIEIVIEASAGRVPVIAGVGCNSTEKTIQRAKAAECAGADALMVVAPYYNRPTRAGLIGHFRSVHDATSTPIVLYNVPHRTAADLDPSCIAVLSRLERVIALKDASADIMRVNKHRFLCGDRLTLLSGDDATALGFNALGGHGAISVTANVAPRLCAEFQRATELADFSKARALHDILMPLHRAIFADTGVAGAKDGLEKLGLCRSDVRQPLEPVTAATSRIIATAMANCGVLPNTDSHSPWPLALKTA